MGLQSRVGTMKVLAVHNRDEIRRYLATTEVENYIYQCNNLDSPFWEATQWYGLYEAGELQALAMFSFNYGPVLLASTYRKDDEKQNQLLHAIQDYLPSNLYAHLNIGAAPSLGHRFKVRSTTVYKNMKLGASQSVTVTDSGRVQHLGSKDYERIIALLEVSHHDYLLDEEFLAAGYFWGIAEGKKLISLVGVTAKSHEFGLVSIGNITTHPTHRQQGLAVQTITKALSELRREFPTVALNVRADNLPAIRCYQKVGFAETGEFAEVIFAEDASAQ